MAYLCQCADGMFVQIISDEEMDRQTVEAVVAFVQHPFWSGWAKINNRTYKLADGKIIPRRKPCRRQCL